MDMQQYPGESKKDEPRIKEESTAELLRESVDYEPQSLGPIAKSQVGGLSTIIITNSENNSLRKFKTFVGLYPSYYFFASSS